MKRLGRMVLQALAVVAVLVSHPIAAQTQSCPPSPSAAPGRNFQGQTLSLPNFSRADLTNANFQGATLKGAVFIGANLTGANFSGATFIDSGSPARPNDFSFANLDSACFIGAKFQAATYLTYATLTCADFSSTDISTGNAIFGDADLKFDPARSCRIKFEGTTMNCEFVAQWNVLDLSNAQIGACANRLQTIAGGTGHDFSDGMYAGVVFDNLDLTGSKWNGAVLERASFQGATLDKATGLSGAPNAPSRLSAAKFNGASVRNVDLSHAQLYGAQFTHADLSDSSLAGAFLQANTAVHPPIENAARFDYARLRNVTLAGAKLQRASFIYTSFYSTFGGATPQVACATTCRPGFTCSCATASGADLTSADFTSAFLYGVDFTGAGTTINGTKFTSAILAGASFAGAKFTVDNGATVDFTKALLQGTTFDVSANLVNASLTDAFVDFGVPPHPTPFDGNALYLQLPADYTRFRGWTGAATPCVQAAYSKISTVPPDALMTCPHGSLTVCGDGRTPQSIMNWQSSIAMASNTVPGWYLSDSTYDKAPANGGACGPDNVDPKW